MIFAEKSFGEFYFLTNCDGGGVEYFILLFKENL